MVEPQAGQGSFRLCHAVGHYDRNSELPRGSLKIHKLLICKAFFLPR